jgi:AmmeMemoRadiSam system protein B/AmmeMemoRadiSam system protein A
MIGHRTHAGDVRQPAVAGLFYPDDRGSLAAAVDGYLAQAGPRDPGPMTGVVVPHAGYRFSGPVAASAYRLVPVDVQRVVLIGPSHSVPLTAMGATTARAWATPFGEVAVDRPEVARLAEHFPGTIVTANRAHTGEHSLEVQLPFLQRVLAPGWTLVPFVVGHLDPDAVASVLADACARPGTLLVVSTDLSHYLPHAIAAVRDRRTGDAVVARADMRIADSDACGAYALRGALRFAARNGRPVTEVDLRSSGDTAGGHERVVGYGAFVIGGSGPAHEEPPLGGRLVALARRTIDEAFRTGRRTVPDTSAMAADLQQPGACFVTLRSGSTGGLLGCVGSLEAVRPLGRDVAVHALDAAFRDPRFPPLTQAQATDLRIGVSVLGPLEPFDAHGYDDLVARLHPGAGVVVAAGDRRATYLPSVWRELPGRAEFVASLWAKAGLPQRAWPDGIAIWTYEVAEYTG